MIVLYGVVPGEEPEAVADGKPEEAGIEVEHHTGAATIGLHTGSHLQAKHCRNAAAVAAAVDKEKRPEQAAVERVQVEAAARKDQTDCLLLLHCLAKVHAAAVAEAGHHTDNLPAALVRHKDSTDTEKGSTPWIVPEGVLLHRECSFAVAAEEEESLRQTDSRRKVPAWHRRIRPVREAGAGPSSWDRTDFPFAEAFAAAAAVAVTVVVVVVVDSRWCRWESQDTATELQRDFLVVTASY